MTDREDVSHHSPLNIRTRINNLLKT